MSMVEREHNASHVGVLVGEVLSSNNSNTSIQELVSTKGSGTNAEIVEDLQYVSISSKDIGLYSRYN